MGFYENWCVYTGLGLMILTSGINFPLFCLGLAMIIYGCVKGYLGAS